MGMYEDNTMLFIFLILILLLFSGDMGVKY
ncbi:hypothetical protein C7959_11315 [Orenia marismortui]|uniref:Uncharacterized protein n=1 Tax=Orenia marismortui TaxID=46469 RepID=A0A4R8GYA2_9FIRM|nr:hypothetical protein C7959_11315 [Orenia marismortui]